MEDAQRLYELILRNANIFLTNARYFEMNVLQGTNPTYDEIAKIMKAVSDVIRDVVDEIDPILAQKAIDYTTIMGRMGEAINAGDQDTLDALVLELEQKPFL